MTRRLCGQQIAVQQVLPWIKRMLFGLLRDDKPAATFLFIGQSGVGKTVLAKELARIVCGNEERLVFFEMTQFHGPSAIPMLIGAPPGYIGFGEGGLTNALRDLPERVLFFHEIDKAEPVVAELLMRFMDSGFVPDAAGPMRDGRKAIVILASSIGQNLDIEKHSSADATQIVEKLIKSAKMRFSPDFLARIDEIVCFVPFSKSACREIVDIAIEREVLRLRQVKGIRLCVDEAARNLIAEAFHDLSLVQGARAARGSFTRCLFCQSLILRLPNPAPQSPRF